MYTTYVSWSGPFPTVEWVCVSEMLLVMVNSEMQVQDQHNYMCFVPTFGGWMLVFGCAYVTLHLSNVQISIHQFKSWVWSSSWGELRMRVPWTHFQQILNQNHMNFPWLVWLLQDDKMIWLFSIVNSKRWKNNLCVHFNVLWLTEWLLAILSPLLP